MHHDVRLLLEALRQRHQLLFLLAVLVVFLVHRSFDFFGFVPQAEQFLSLLLKFGQLNLFLDSFNGLPSQLFLLDTVLADSVDEADDFEDALATRFLGLQLKQLLGRGRAAVKLGIHLLNLVEVVDELENGRDEVADHLDFECRLNLAQVELDQAVEQVLEATKVDELLFPDALLLISSDCHLHLGVFVVHLVIFAVRQLDI